MSDIKDKVENISSKEKSSITLSATRAMNIPPIKLPEIHDPSTLGDITNSTFKNSDGVNDAETPPAIPNSPSALIGTNPSTGIEAFTSKLKTNVPISKNKKMLTTNLNNSIDKIEKKICLSVASQQAADAKALISNAKTEAPRKLKLHSASSGGRLKAPTIARSSNIKKLGVTAFYYTCIGTCFVLELDNF